jgi:hypothetical protein
MQWAVLTIWFLSLGFHDPPGHGCYRETEYVLTGRTGPEASETVIGVSRNFPRLLFESHQAGRLGPAANGSLAPRGAKARPVGAEIRGRQ